MVGEAVDPLLELGDGGEGAAADGLLRDDMEPDFDLVEPGRVGRGEVEMVAGSGGEPAFNAGVLVGAVVVDNAVDVAVREYASMCWRKPRNSWWRCSGALVEDPPDGELEVLLPVGLEVERGSEALDRGLRQPGGG